MSNNSVSTEFGKLMERQQLMDQRIDSVVYIKALK